jgi:ABC-type transport system involved in multi-copper enzyme maturation permease subunit
MNQIVAIARNTFLETIRDRILNAILVFAVLLIVASILLGQLSAGQDVKIIKDLGLASVSFFGVVIAIFVGTSLVHKELDKRTVFVVLTKPVNRARFLVGKLLGLMTTLTMLTILMGLAYLGLLVFLRVPVEVGLFQAIMFSWLELIVLTTMTLLFSTFSSPVLSMLYAFAMYFYGHNAQTFKLLAQKAAPGLRELLLGAYYVVLPNLTHFDIKNRVVYGYTAGFEQVGLAIAYSLVYSLGLFCVAAVIFHKREF